VLYTYVVALKTPKVPIKSQRLKLPTPLLTSLVCNLLPPDTCHYDTKKQFCFQENYL
jgi:hypothetical protein